MALRCQNGHENVDGAFFCEQCGEALGGAQGEAALLCPTCGLPNLPDATTCVNCAAPLAEAQAALPPITARLVDIATGTTFDLSDHQEAVIGRNDPTSDMFAEIDLGPLGGEDKGVSRHHARWRRERDTFTIEDLQSVNYTFLNKQRLAPNIPTPLKFGDELRLGRILLRFEGE